MLLASVSWVAVNRPSEQCGIVRGTHDDATPQASGVDTVEEERFMSDSNDDTRRERLSRRGFMKSSAGVAGGLLVGSQFGQFGTLAHGADHPALGNYPIKGANAVFGFCVPQTGAYADEGEDELRAYKLAVKHLNEGGGML